jgi:hypothetical protein
MLPEPVNLHSPRLHLPYRPTQRSKCKGCGVAELHYKHSPEPINMSWVYRTPDARQGQLVLGRKLQVQVIRALHLRRKMQGKPPNSHCRLMLPTIEHASHQ